MRNHLHFEGGFSITLAPICNHNLHTIHCFITSHKGDDNMNNDIRLKLTWINKEEFQKFLESVIEKCQTQKTYTDTFCFKFNNGFVLNANLSFKQDENGNVCFCK